MRERNELASCSPQAHKDERALACRKELTVEADIGADVEADIELESQVLADTLDSSCLPALTTKMPQQATARAPSKVCQAGILAKSRASKRVAQISDV